MKLKINEIELDKRFRKDLGDIDTLAKSINEIGLLHPIVVTPDNHLICGARRLAAHRKLGRDEIEATVIDLENITRGEFDENEYRKNFTWSERCEIANELEPVEKEAAKERQGERTDKHVENFSTCLDTTTTSKVPGEKSDKPNPKQRALDLVANAIGVSRPTLVKAQEIYQSGNTDLISEMDRTGRVSGIHRRMKITEQARKIRQEPHPQPQGPFRVIVVDPPWTYSNRADDPAHRAANPYPSMTKEQIAALPIAKLSETDAILWLWTTNAHIQLAFQLVEQWGFQYKTMLTWAKDRMGTGDWLRGQTEHCLLCIKGHPTITLSNQTTLLHGPLREHSRKPDEFYCLVDALCPGSKLDYFAREERKGWMCYGNDTNRFPSDR